MRSKILEDLEKSVDFVYNDTAGQIKKERPFLFFKASLAFLCFLGLAGWLWSVGRITPAWVCIGNCFLILGALWIRLRSDASLLRDIKSCKI